MDETQRTTTTEILADLLDEERLADPAQRDFAQGLIDRLLQNAERRSLRRVVEQALNDFKARWTPGSGAST